MEKILPGWQERHNKVIEQAKGSFNQSNQVWQNQETKRSNQLEQLKAEYDAKKASYDAAVQQRNQEVEEFRKAYSQGDPNAVVEYCSMVLERSQYPDGFPQKFRVAYVP